MPNSTELAKSALMVQATELRSRDRLLLVALALNADEDDACEASVPQLALWCQTSVTRLRESPRVLFLFGLIVVDPPAREGVGCNRYHLALPVASVEVGS